MKKVLLGICLLLFACSAVTVNAQNILDASDEDNYTNYYDRTMNSQKKAMPFQALRGNDVIWETCIWRTIDFRENFNQFFFFPVVEEMNSGNQGRINLANLIYKFAEAEEIPIYADDELKVPIEWSEMSGKLNKMDTTKTDPIRDEYDEIIAEGHDTVLITKFTSQDYYQVRLKEYWYIDKQDTRMKVRIVALALVYNSCRDVEGERTCNLIDRFWIPMNRQTVRDVLARHDAYDRNNNNMERSYDEIFLSRYFDSFVTRETNTYNRSIKDYLTGLDAQMESQKIEETIFDLESDMWEY